MYSVDEFIDAHLDKIRYVTDKRKFLVWIPEKNVWQYIDNDYVLYFNHGISWLKSATKNIFDVKNLLTRLKKISSIQIQSTDVNVDSWILPCSNCYIDLKKFHDNEPDFVIGDEKKCMQFYSTRSTGTDFNPDSDSDLVYETFRFPFRLETEFEQFMKIASTSLVDDNLIKKFVILYGDRDAGGHTLSRIIDQMLGDFSFYSDLNYFLLPWFKQNIKASLVKKFVKMRFVVVDEIFDTRKISGEVLNKIIGAENVRYYTDRGILVELPSKFTVFGVYYNKFPQFKNVEQDFVEKNTIVFRLKKNMYEFKPYAESKIEDKLARDRYRSAILNLLLKFLRKYFDEGL